MPRPLTERERGRLAAALLEWAQRHPAPDVVVLRALDGWSATPQQLAVGVAERTQDGLRLESLIGRVLDEDLAFDDVLDGILRSGQPGQGIR